MNEYLLVIEGSGDSFSAFAPDLRGCVAASNSPEEVEQPTAEAIALHIESLRSHGESIPEPQSAARYVAS
jgi:predicted RNase H-like HicB family nuclease